MYAEQAKTALHYTWINASCHREIFNFFDLDPTMIPSLVFYTANKNKHTTMIGKFDYSTVMEQSDLFLNGKLPVFKPKVDKRDIIIEEKDCSLDQQAPAEDDGFDDILAEILKEEAAKAAAAEDFDEKPSKTKKKAQKKSKVPPMQWRFSMCHSILKKAIGHMSDATIGNDVRRIHIFDTWNKLQIKAEVEEVKILDEVMMYEYGGVQIKVVKKQS